MCHEKKQVTESRPIETIFTSGWELPVRIGAERVEALFVSGREPKLTLISKKKNVSGGEEVFLSSRDFPLGLTLGTVGAVTEPSEDIFKEARLAVPYAITELTKLFVRLP